jgi:hypothetical protein
MGHATMENRHGLAVTGMVTHANGTAERRASEIMLKAKSKAAGHRITAGEDKAYDTVDHVANLRAWDPRQSKRPILWVLQQTARRKLGVRVLAPWRHTCEIR